MKCRSLCQLVVGSFILSVGSVTSSNANAQLTIGRQIIEPVTPIIDSVPVDVGTVRDVLEAQVEQGVESTFGPLANIPTPQFTVPSPLSLTSPAGSLVLKEIKAPDGFLAVEREWLFVGSEADRTHFSHPDITIESSHYLTAIGQWIYRLKVSTSLDELSQIRNNLPESLKAQVGRNHIYLAQSKGNPDSQNNSQHVLANTTPTDKPKVCQAPVRIGMIDTSIAQNHELLKHLVIEQQSFLPQALPTTQAHGTSVAGLLADNMLAGSHLYNASVFYTRNSISQGATLLSLIDGLNYLVAKQVDAINMSLAGPENPVLSKVVQKISEQGVQILAAVGNEGPASPPMFPAAYPSTIAVTAVDSKHVIYRWANQGNYVDFAASGVSVEVAHPDGTTSRETGTSMATPLVSARYACLFRASSNPAQALATLRDQAIDAGAPGRDPVFGVGILH
ncbi:Subtilase family protein [Alteromonas sp. 38]|uniref:S8 family serine peptidase n=1 Tax=unclassified Alteromonas TaxID=2614992 RepID=UPI0012F36B11|nr:MULTISPECIES: S8 family serine peptidase [unclassified Alteromonas]CAD5248705.1 Subtilase family protein [Alteromonas sp. 154]VXC50089.1 Subtilase family protein [Alteromonas sp. 38]